MIYFSQQIAQMKQIGKSLRSCLSASPSACLAHANLAKNAKTRSYDYGSHRNIGYHQIYLQFFDVY